MGSVYKRGSKLWLAYREADGTRSCRSSGFRVGEEKAAERLLAELEAQVANGVPVGTIGPETIASYAKKWLAARPTSVESAGDERSRIENHILPTLGGLALTELRPRHVRDLIATLRSKASARGKPLAPRTVRSCRAILHRMLQDAVVDELIPSNPCVLKHGELPGKVDADPAWRAGAVFTREETIAIINDPRVPEDRRVIYALMFLGGLRFGEAAALRWRAYDAAAEPLGKLLVATSFSTKKRKEKATKTQRPRELPVHRALALILAAWKRDGFKRQFGKAPTADDLIIPSREGRNRNANHGLKRFHEDLDRLGLRQRRQHDLRRTFISLALADGARKDVLRWVTHGPSGDIIDQYTTLPWSALCEAVTCLRIELPIEVAAAVQAPRLAAVGADDGGASPAGSSSDRRVSLRVERAASEGRLVRLGVTPVAIEPSPISTEERSVAADQRLACVEPPRRTEPNPATSHGAADGVATVAATVAAGEPASERKSSRFWEPGASSCGRGGRDSNPADACSGSDRSTRSCSNVNRFRSTPTPTGDHPVPFRPHLCGKDLPRVRHWNLVAFDFADRDFLGPTTAATALVPTRLARRMRRRDADQDARRRVGPERCCRVGRRDRAARRRDRRGNAAPMSLEEYRAHVRQRRIERARLSHHRRAVATVGESPKTSAGRWGFGYPFAMGLDDLLKAALRLTDQERAELAGQLIASLDASSYDSDYDEAWSKEIDRRLAGVEDGSAELVDADDVLAAMQKRVPPR